MGTPGKRCGDVLVAQATVLEDPSALEAVVADAALPESSGLGGSTMSNNHTGDLKFIRGVDGMNPTLKSTWGKDHKWPDEKGANLYDPKYSSITSIKNKAGQF